MIGLRELTREIGVMIVLAVILATIGAMGTFDQPFAARLVTWLLLALGGYACFRPVIAVGTWLSQRASLPSRPMITLASALAAVPATLFVAFLVHGSIGRMSLAELATLCPYVLLLGAIATAIQLLVRRPDRLPAENAPPEPAAPAESEQTAPVVEAPPVPPSPFLESLPPVIAQGLLYVGNEDHYVRAYAAAGEAMVLARMRDVVAGLSGRDGARVHRSWWVSRAAVAGTVRRERALYLRLVDGREVPVARPMVAELKAAGWLADV